MTANVTYPRQLLDPPYSYVAYGPDTNCTLSVCPVELSVYQYRPSVPANAIFIALYGIALILHLTQGFMYRAWTFAGCMFFGCVTELLGYGGRIMLYKDPFSFAGFLMQISVFPHRIVACPKKGPLTALVLVCITIAPVFYTAAIYVTLSKWYPHLQGSIQI